MGKVTGEEGWLSLGPWGPQGWSQRSRSEASYKADGPVMEMTVHYNTKSIDAISFQSKSCDGVPIGCSEIIGSSHGKMTQKVWINSSVEQLLSISLTYNTFYMTSVTFHTNQNKYGPIGPFDEKDTTYSTPSDCGVIVGFHGCGDVDHNNRLLAIGIFVVPIVQSSHSIQDPNFGPSKDKYREREREREREEMALPKFVVIKSASNKTYLQLPYGENTLLKFKELGSHSKGYKHEVEEAKSEAGLVHIKCCKTGKYWTLVGMHSNIIAAEADKPEEDGTSAACTLIKPTLKCIGGVTVVNFQFQRQSKWQSVFLNSMGCLESSENMAEDFIVSDWEKLRRPHPNKSTGTPTGGDAMVEGIEIDGVFIGGVEARGPGHLSVFGSSFGGGSSAGDGVSVVDVNIKPSDVPVGGKFGKRTIKGGLRIGYPPIKEGVRTIKAGSAGDGVSVAGAGVGAYIHGVEEIGRSSKGMDTGDGGRGVGGESGGAGALAGVAASEGVGSGVRASEGADAGAEGEGAEGAPYIHAVEEIGRSSKGMDTSDGDIGNTYPTLATARQVCIELEKILTPPFQLSHLELIDWKDQERVQIVSQYDVLYKAALTADWDTAAKFLGQEPDAVFQPITWSLETALIVAVRSAKRNHFVKMVMEKMQREGVALIAQQDISGATALHAAVDGGNIEASVWLVQKNSELANIGDKDGTLAVHVAADLGNREMVDILLQHTTKLSETESGLKLLHSLASSGLYDIALTFLQQHRNLASMKPSPLVVLAEKPTSFLSGTNFNFLERLIYSVIPLKLKDIENNHTEARDVIANENSTPERDIENHTQERDIANHPPERDIENPTQEREIENPCKCYECCCDCIVSALIHVRHKLCSVDPVVRVHCFQKLTALFWDVAEKLVPRIKSIREIKLNHLQALRLVKRLTEEVVTETELRSATEIFTETVRKATCMGIHEIVEEICESFPRAIHLRSEKYRSLFHLAIAYRRENVFNLIYQMEENWHGILSMPDASTNNALHLAGNLRPQQQILLRASVAGAALQMQRELQWFEEVRHFILPQAKKEMNADGKTPQELFTETHKDLVTEGEQWMKDTANSCTIVAALITTIVFAAAITVPGGSFSDSGSDKKGLPIRLGGRAFTMFGVSDTLAMFFSSSSLLMFLSILTCRYGEEDFRCSLPRRLIIGLVTLFLSIISMMVAFGATLKIVFGEKTAWIVIPVAILSCVPVVLFALWQFPLLYAMIKSTYFPGIFGKKSNRILH